ncbi:hypothetical protein IAT38_006255 [Cryptococcus sp. DSM 104549]
MSSKASQKPLFSRGMFDILGDDQDAEQDDYEEEVEEVAPPVTTSTSSSSSESTPVLSKSARKRLARLAAKTSEVVDAAVGQVSSSAAAVAQAVSSVEAPQNATASASSPKEDAPKPEPTPAKAANGNASTPKPVEKAAPAAVKKESVKPAANDASSSSAPVQIPKKSAKAGDVGSSLPGAASPPQSSFSPNLPPTLPQPTGNVLPANRKRKTPQDFTPSGPGNSMSPSSPSKIGVKFEDGLAPGEGQEGEKIIAPPKKDRNAVERTIWTFIMIGGFITLLCMGPPYMILLVMLCQTLVYKEVTALFDLRDHGAANVVVPPGEKGDRWSKTLNWYFFVVTNYFLYGESIIYYFKHIVFVDAYFTLFARNHRFISFMLYVVGFVGFVGNLKREYLRQQFALFCWVHISLLLIVVSSHFIVNNILEGLVWFFVPASLVICNDVMAYVCGKLFGKTPLIKLSPKKTVEGFVGAFLCTLLFGLAWGTFFMRFPYMICPARDLGTNVFSQITCRPNPVFVWREFHFTGAAEKCLSTLLGHAPPAIPYAPFQLHVLVMATFASLVAPFGGFFASGFKRAFNIKDFGHSIPGHGGMTDRMDCQFMMGLFSYVYYSSLIRIQYVTVGSIMQTVATSLTAAEQLELLGDLKRFLGGQGLKAV